MAWDKIDVLARFAFPARAGHFGAWVFGPRRRRTQAVQEEACAYKQGTPGTVSDLSPRQTGPLTKLPLGVFLARERVGAGARFRVCSEFRPHLGLHSPSVTLQSGESRVPRASACQATLSLPPGSCGVLCPRLQLPSARTYPPAQAVPSPVSRIFTWLPAPLCVLGVFVVTAGPCSRRLRHWGGSAPVRWDGDLVAGAPWWLWGVSSRQLATSQSLVSADLSCLQPPSLRSLPRHGSRAGLPLRGAILDPCPEQPSTFSDSW